MVDENDFLPENEAADDVEDDSFPLLSTEAFEGELSALEEYGAASEEAQSEQDEVEEEALAVPALETGQDELEPDDQQAELAALDEEDRLRQPRAQNFRRRLRSQVSMLPLALYLLALGGFLIARQQDVKDLPDISSLTLSEISILVFALTVIFHAFVSGRRERGLLFAGLLVWVSGGMLAVLVYGVDRHPDAVKWWPLLLWSLALTLIVTFLIERTHDSRLVLLSILILVAGGVAYGVTSDRISQTVLDRAADYWPLLLSVAGIGLLPLAFRRRTG